jgi:hypothetical protein
MQSALLRFGFGTKAVHILALIMKTKTCFITQPDSLPTKFLAASLTPSRKA